MARNKSWLHTHDIAWPRTVADALPVQNALRHKVRVADDYGTIKTIAGVDCSYDRAANTTRAVIALVDFDSLKPLTSFIADVETAFPYVPGFLSFREIPAILAALENLDETPDLLMVDGQGIAHPRRLGIAAHLGALLDIPAIGVAKSRLTGTYSEPGPRRGDRSPLYDRGETIGTVLRSRDNTAPLYISPGHRVGHDSALAITLRCLGRYRLPEPTRIADKISKSRGAKPGLLP